MSKTTIPNSIFTFNSTFLFPVINLATLWNQKHECSGINISYQKSSHAELRNLLLLSCWECAEYTLREKCPNTEFFLVRIQSECGKIRTRKNSVFGHISRIDIVAILVGFPKTHLGRNHFLFSFSFAAVNSCTDSVGYNFFSRSSGWLLLKNVEQTCTSFKEKRKISKARRFSSRDKVFT